MDRSTTETLRESSHRLIPGGCHTYSKGDDQFPDNAPGFIVRGRGCHVWDVDGNEFVEYGMGLRSVSLGHAYQPVVEAASRQILNGSNFTRPAPIEIECAERLADLVGADQVKFTKDGSSVTTAAVRLARAVTGREKIAVCADHPFFSYDDWFIGKTPMAAGIPHSVIRNTVSFRYNDLDDLRGVFERNEGEIACVIMEAARTDEPATGYLSGVRDLAHSNGALFVLDEMITGFRFHPAGAQALYGVEADLAAFGKAMANGFAVSALVGKREYMDLGGIRHDRERVFLLSTTHGAETHALAACLATMEAYESEGVVDVLYRQGARLREGVAQVAASHGVTERFYVAGRDSNLVFVTKDASGRPSQEFRTLFLQEMIKQGIIAPSFVVSLAHTDEDIDRTIAAVDASLVAYRRALDEGTREYLDGPSVRPVYRPNNRVVVR